MTNFIQMKTNDWYKLMFISLLIAGFCSCNTKLGNPESKEISQVQNEELFKSVLQKHLTAVANKDYKTLESTMSPDGKMELIQPSSETVYGVKGFMDFHQEWFDLPNWTIKTKVLSTDVGDKIGVATTEFYYEEPERNGKPYFNRLVVSYTLEKVNNEWFIIKDHASSIEKTK